MDSYPLTDPDNDPETLERWAEERAHIEEGMSTEEEA